ncbi:hypothetical protein PR048_020447 [Dryococelus australis]|uniref:Uncharacterized protein n=1 Tax=Dryococelus australis TaxID=614101 RepID=A0ABQ9H6A5_9NEOP|nr:hypothetical protein PR048_020447 [Dryococelus australis]
MIRAVRVGGKREIPGKTRRPAASSSTIPTCENYGATPPGIEPVSPRWEASSLTTTQPQLPVRYLRLAVYSTIPTCDNYGATPPGIEPVSPRWEASSLTTTQPRLPVRYLRLAVYSTIPTCENYGATPPGIEPVSPRWEASSLTTTQPRLPVRYLRLANKGSTEQNRRLINDEAVLSFHDLITLQVFEAHPAAQPIGTFRSTSGAKAVSSASQSRSPNVHAHIKGDGQAIFVSLCLFSFLRDRKVNPQWLQSSCLLTKLVGPSVRSIVSVAAGCRQHTFQRPCPTEQRPPDTWKVVPDLATSLTYNIPAQNTISAYTRQKDTSKCINRIRLERAPQKQSSGDTPYDRVKRCKKIKTSERVNVDVFSQNKRPCPQHSHTKIIVSTSVRTTRLRRGCFALRTAQPMRVIEVSMEQLRNEGAGEAGDPREDPPNNGIVRHDCHMRKSGVTRPGVELGSPWPASKEQRSHLASVHVSVREPRVAKWSDRSPHDMENKAFCASETRRTLPLAGGYRIDNAVCLTIAEGSLARALASHHGDQGSIPGGFTPGSSQGEIVLDDAAYRRVFSGYSRFPVLAFQRRSILGLHAMSGDDGHLWVPAGKPVTRRVLSHPGFTPRSIDAAGTCRGYCVQTHHYACGRQAAWRADVTALPSSARATNTYPGCFRPRVNKKCLKTAHDKCSFYHEQPIRELSSPVSEKRFLSDNSTLASAGLLPSLAAIFKWNRAEVYRCQAVYLSFESTQRYERSSLASCYKIRRRGKETRPYTLTNSSRATLAAETRAGHYHQHCQGFTTLDDALGASQLTAGTIGLRGDRITMNNASHGTMCTKVGRLPSEIFATATTSDGNARCHVSRATMQWYADNNVRILDRPAQSPDLNPIKHLWDELYRRVRARQARPKYISQLVEWLQEKWRRIPVDVLQTLVENMPDRVAAVTTERGVLVIFCFDFDGIRTQKLRELRAFANVRTAASTWDYIFPQTTLLKRSEMGMEQRRNAWAEETGDPRENAPTSGIVWHDSPKNPGIEPGSPRWEASGLTTAQPIRAPKVTNWLVNSYYFCPVYYEYYEDSYPKEPMRAIEVKMEQHRNERVGETGDHREDPPTNGIVRHDSHLRKPGDPGRGLNPIKKLLWTIDIPPGARVKRVTRTYDGDTPELGRRRSTYPRVKSRRGVCCKHGRWPRLYNQGHVNTSRLPALANQAAQHLLRRPLRRAARRATEGLEENERPPNSNAQQWRLRNEPARLVYLIFSIRAYTSSCLSRADADNRNAIDADALRRNLLHPDWLPLIASLRIALLWNQL